MCAQNHWHSNQRKEKPAAQINSTETSVINDRICRSTDPKSDALSNRATRVQANNTPESNQFRNQPKIDSIAFCADPAKYIQQQNGKQRLRMCAERMIRTSSST
jgi:hypothetical protein